MIALRGAIHVACFHHSCFIQGVCRCPQQTWMNGSTTLFFSAREGGVNQMREEEDASMKTLGVQMVTAVAQIGVAAIWPAVVCWAIYKFRDQLNRLLEALIGFVGRSCYRMGSVPDDWTLDRVSVRNFCGCKRTDKVLEKIEEMQKGDYSFAPIVDGQGRVVAVFTPACVQRIATGELKVDVNMDFAALLDAADGKFADMNVGAYRFIAEGDSVKSVRQYFAGKWGDGQDFGIVFVTQCGSSSEPLKGVVTVWDVVKK